jgi:hypothetical protein
MKAYATKLIDLTETKAEDMARQWAADVRKNHRTPSYHGLPNDKLIDQAVSFYKNFRQMFFTESPYNAASAFFTGYAEECYRGKIPLQEALYALILMRRHIWLYAEFQATFITAVEQQQSAESLNRTILMFDYATYQITEKYQELISRDVDRKLGAIKTLRMEGHANGKQGVKAGLMVVLLLVACILTGYYHAARGTGVIFTHLFYIPIILASIWWGKKGILVALFLGILIIISHAVFLAGAPFSDDIVRAVMFIAISFVVARLMEGLKKVEDLYKTLAT